MPITCKFVHVNIVAKDWLRLAEFYMKVFGCKPIPPERNLSGDWLERGTGIKGAHINGMHLKLPGNGNEGPTLEIFEYNQRKNNSGIAVNMPGFSHICFRVEDVEEARKTVMNAGGEAVGSLESVEIPNVGKITFAYVTDPEGNIIELQNIEK